MDEPRWGWLLAALAVYGVSAFGGALQWAWILRAAGIAAPAREIRRLYFIGLFFNNFLPANIGGDAYKIVDLGRQRGRAPGGVLRHAAGPAAGPDGPDRCWRCWCWPAAALARIPLPRTALLLMPVLLLLAAVLACAALPADRRPRCPSWWRRLRPGRAGRAAGAQRDRRVRPLPAAGALAEPDVRSSAWGCSSCGVADPPAGGLGPGLRPGAATRSLQLLVLIPMLAISLTLPVTINGIGLRESVSANLLTWAGLTAPQAVAMEVAAYLVQVVFSLQGGVLLWLGRWGRQAAAGRELDRRTIVVGPRCGVLV